MEKINGTNWIVERDDDGNRVQEVWGKYGMVFKTHQGTYGVVYWDAGQANKYNRQEDGTRWKKGEESFRYFKSAYIHKFVKSIGPLHTEGEQQAVRLEIDHRHRKVGGASNGNQ